MKNGGDGMSYLRNAFEYLEASAAAVPDKTAFADALYSYTFFEFQNASVAVGCTLRASVDGKRRNVVVLADRNVLTLVGMFGAMAAGFTYVPVDVKMPDDRLRMVMNTASTSTATYSTPQDLH